MDTESSFTAGKKPEREANYLPPSIAEAKNANLHFQYIVSAESLI
jgi:hypothetical protein